MDSAQAKVNVFLSYCRKDIGDASRLRDDLIAAGIDVWWDGNIRPGQDWQFEIRAALKRCNFVVLCLSQQCLERASAGIYPEALDAIATYRERRPGGVYLIPARLSECEIPGIEIDATRRLDRLQHVNLFPESCRREGVQRIIDTVTDSGPTPGNLAAAPAPAASRAKPGKSLPGDVLIIEDNLTERRDMQEYLRESLPDLRVKSAANPAEAISLLKQQVFDVVVSDMILEGNLEGGYEMLLEIKNANPGVEVIVVTHAPNLEHAVKCMRAGCLHYGKKPSPEALTAHVEQAMELSRGRRRSLIELLILANWTEVTEAVDKNKKGRYLRSLVGHLVRTIPGWTVTERVRWGTEEFDLVVQNESDDGSWRQRSSLILFEFHDGWAKQRKPGQAEYKAFYSKLLKLTPDYCKLGFFVSFNGVYPAFEEASRTGGIGLVIVTLDKNAIWDWICAVDRSQWLKDRIQDRVIGKPSVAPRRGRDDR